MTVTEVSIMNFATSLLIFTWFDNDCSLFSKRKYYLHQSLFLLPVWPCRKTKDTWYWNVFQKNETDCSTVTLMSCSGLDHPLLQQLPHHQTDPKCIDEEHNNCTMKTDFYSLWSKWYWPEFHHKIPLILLFSKYMKLFEIWFILWPLKFCFEISINWFMAFFF